MVSSPSTQALRDCPPGYSLAADAEAAERRAGIPTSAAERAAEASAENLCVAVKHPEGAIELILRQEGLESVRSAPYERVAPDAFANGLNESKGLPKAGKTTGTSGTWSQFGTGPLIVNDPDYARVNGLGLVDNMGRLDSLEYDAATNGCSRQRERAASGCRRQGIRGARSETACRARSSAPSATHGERRHVGRSQRRRTYGSGASRASAPSTGRLGATWQKATGIPTARPDSRSRLIPAIPTRSTRRRRSGCSARPTAARATRTSTCRQGLAPASRAAARASSRTS